jgi:ATP-binding cassette subfamily B protein/subfamily B ATP-binding cassette protein MsbA
MSPYRRLLAYAAPYWRGWTVIVVGTLLSTALSLLQPWPLKILVDHVLGSAEMAPRLAALGSWVPGFESRSGLLAWVVAATLIIFAVNSLVDVVLTLGWTRVGRRMVYDLARDLFAAAQRRSLVFHTRHSVGDSISRITGDAWCVHTIVDTLLFGPGHALFTLVTMLVIMFALDPVLTSFALAVAPFMAGTAWFFGKPIRAAAARGAR